ncbi:nuclease-related domain-containing protein [Sporolactobacillus pectinivorans]|uniref:nuclease-related domain-containing protein n=1 Tax=Sporolactobacillus pectinivorans TaxID=1591408 RepID=UPI0012FE7B81|nr:nuclease-related domain-containing protein [Sporolactobacillus pectinivorans]
MQKDKLGKQLKRYLVSCKGEAAVAYQLGFLPEKEFLILHNLRLRNSLHHFQMDCLLLNTYFFLIVEVKNIAGTLHFD